MNRSSISFPRYFRAFFSDFADTRADVFHIQFVFKPPHIVPLICELEENCVCPFFSSLVV